MFKKFFSAVVVSFLLVSSVVAQTWEKSPEKDYHSSIVKISGDGYSGSGTVIEFIEKSKEHDGYYIGIILTASHVIKSRDTKMKVFFQNGKNTLYNSVISKSTIESGFDDIALIRALIPNDIKPIEISKDPVPFEAEVELCGFGTGQFRHWNAKYGGSLYNDGGHVVFSWAIQGDSGGPIIYKGKVVGVICFGMGMKKYEDTRRMIVGPVYGTSVDKIKYTGEQKARPEDDGSIASSSV